MESLGFEFEELVNQRIGMNDSPRLESRNVHFNAAPRSMG